jgi:membrane protease YdiL (CAAX protease family)
MNNTPDQSPFEPEDLAPPEESATREPLQLPAWTDELADPSSEHVPPPAANPQITGPEDEPPIFQQFYSPTIEPEDRIPHLGHVGILCVLALCGLIAASLLARSALYFHLFGVSTLNQATNDIRYTLGSEAIFYFVTLGCCLLVFPVIWRKGFLAGLQWRGITALRLRGRLASAAVLCFLLAIVNGELMPGPSDAPIDLIFRTPGAAWLLFAFGITLAPFFEEFAFRGFLLPALCTACDWIAERATDTPAPPLDENGHPQWSLPAMAVASVLTSLPFALMHAYQTGYSLGPFLLLLFVSLVLCWIRLSTRSLASSVLVHACYNLLLFSLMVVGTGGFRHLENL